MKRVTVRVPEETLDAAEELVDAGLYPNRSEVVRDGLRHALMEHMESLQSSDGNGFSANEIRTLAGESDRLEADGGDRR